MYKIILYIRNHARLLSFNNLNKFGAISETVHNIDSIRLPYHTSDS